MKRYVAALLFFVSALAVYGQPGRVSGVVVDEGGVGLPGANVLVEGSPVGTTTGLDGRYELVLDAGSYTLRVSFVGYATQSGDVTLEAGESATLDFQLVEGLTFGEEVVVSGSKRPEKLTESPATIETIYSWEIEQTASPLPGEILARQKGIDYFRAGLASPAINVRGFNSNFNAKNLQVTDGRYSTLIATGLPFGPLNTVVKEDIEAVEVILGPNATLYGPNAHNGLLNTVTKDPRRSEGTTYALSAGVTGAEDTGPLTSARFRQAQVLNDRLSYKVNLEYFKGEEFRYDDSVYIDRLDAEGRSARDPEFAGLDGKKEAYTEYKLNEDIRFVRAEGALYYALNDRSDLIYNTGYSSSTYLAPTNVGRNQIDDWRIQYHQLRYTSDNWFAQVYYTTSKTENTYAIDQRTKNYYALFDGGASEAEAELGSLSPARGALFVDDSKRWNAEIQYNNEFGALSVVAGSQWQRDLANSEGTYLIEQTENPYYNGTSIQVDQVGGYVHMDYDLGNGWKGILAARGDYHDVYEFNLVPKAGILKVNDWGTLRLTYSQGIAAPTILNMFGNLFNGLILGNANGFTMADGSMVEKQVVEKIQTFELGYRGMPVANKLALDFNAYYNVSRDFLSPLAVLGVASKWGDVPMMDVQGGFAGLGGFVASYVNFGRINTYGADLSATLYLAPRLSATVNYSYFDYGLDEEDLEENDFDNNGEVNFLDVLINAPNHKGGIGLNYNGDRFFGNLFARWVEQYNYFSSFQIASETLVKDDGTPYTYRGLPIVENTRSADAFNYGPLGGFVTFDLSIGYRVSDMLTLSATAINLLNQEIREFTAAPPTSGIYTLEVKVNLPAASRTK